uniref:Uncharacterized protein n=1 Tax=Sus scrofa TaxID=9823 RepID=A0A8D1C8J4_PIG
MEETPPPLLGSSKPHLEKLTLGITRILGECEGETPGTTEGHGACSEAQRGDGRLDPAERAFAWSGGCRAVKP